MTGEQILRNEFVNCEVNLDFTEAVVALSDHSRLCFCHRVGERWAKSLGPAPQESVGGSADKILARIALFRLNRKHLDIQFADGSRWEVSFRERNTPQ